MSHTLALGIMSGCSSAVLSYRILHQIADGRGRQEGCFDNPLLGHPLDDAVRPYPPILGLWAHASLTMLLGSESESVQSARGNAAEPNGVSLFLPAPCPCCCPDP